MKVLLLFAALTAAHLVLAAEESSPATEMGVERLDPAFDALVPANAKVEKLAGGFLWSEGPTWFQGPVVFSDVPDNVIYQWKPGERAVTVFMKPSGLLKWVPGFRQPGSNGLAVDADGRLLICQQGERRVARLEKNGMQTAIATKFNGKRFNSPDDLAIRKNGDVYFTDPPYGLANFNASPLKEPPRHVRRAEGGRATGPGGVLVLNPAGKHLGSILTNQLTGNCCWGDDDGGASLGKSIACRRASTRASPIWMRLFSSESSPALRRAVLSARSASRQFLTGKHFLAALRRALWARPKARARCCSLFFAQL